MNSSLHDQIMNIGNSVSDEFTHGERQSYNLGHRNARHAAAELALKADKRIKELERVLIGAMELLELDSEANEPGTDVFTWLYAAKFALGDFK